MFYIQLFLFHKIIYYIYLYFNFLFLVLYGWLYNFTIDKTIVSYVFKDERTTDFGYLFKDCLKQQQSFPHL